MYWRAINIAPDQSSRASIHKNLTKAHELMCKLKGLEVEIQLYHFEQIIKHTNNALLLGHTKG